MTLQSTEIRILAPIPGKQAAGCTCANALGMLATPQAVRAMGVNTGTGAGGYMELVNDLMSVDMVNLLPKANFRSERTNIAVANDTNFGLSSGICTTSLKHATHFKRHSQAGMVMVNLPTAGVDYHVPFGGRKGSSYGSREQGRYAQEFYTVVKTSYIGS